MANVIAKRSQSPHSSLHFRQSLSENMILMKYAHTHKNHRDYTTKYPIQK